jgi:carbonic anhydrase
MCSADFGNQAPLILKTQEAIKLPNDNFFFAQMNKNVTGVLNLENFNNNLVLTFDDASPMGTIYYNLEKDEQQQRQFFFFNCTKLYFRLPGEHIVEGVRYDMELQFNCSGVIPGDKQKNYKNAFVAIPVQKVKNFEAQSQFFDSFENLKLGSEITIRDFEEALDAFSMFKKVFFYSGGTNYPDCLVGANWIFVDNVMKVREKVYKQLFDLLDKNQIEDGNYREASPKKEDYYLLESSLENKLINGSF